MGFLFDLSTDPTEPAAKPPATISATPAVVSVKADKKTRQEKGLVIHEDFHQGTEEWLAPDLHRQNRQSFPWILRRME